MYDDQPQPPLSPARSRSYSMYDDQPQSPRLPARSRSYSLDDDQPQSPRLPARSRSYSMYDDAFEDSFPEYSPAMKNWIDKGAPPDSAIMKDPHSPPRRKSRGCSKRNLSRNLSITSNSSEMSAFSPPRSPRANDAFRTITPETSPSSPDPQQYQLELVEGSPGSRRRSARKSKRSSDSSRRRKGTSDRKPSSSSSSSRHEETSEQRKSRRSSSSTGEKARTSSSRKGSSKRDLKRSTRSSRNLSAAENAMVPYGGQELSQIKEQMAVDAYNAHAMHQAHAMMQAHAMIQAEGMKTNQSRGIVSVPNTSQAGMGAVGLGTAGLGAAGLGAAAAGMGSNGMNHQSPAGMGSNGMAETIGSNHYEQQKHEMMMRLGTDPNAMRMVSQSVESTGLGNVLPANQMAQAMQMASHPTETMNKYLHDPSALMKGLESNPFARRMMGAMGNPTKMMDKVMGNF